jgi:hypothetical protein
MADAVTKTWLCWLGRRASLRQWRHARFAVTAASGSAVNTNEPAYLVQLHGHFTALDASVPSRAKLPTGSYLTFIVDASDGSVTDWGVGIRKADLYALGSVIALSW